ncbi:MAG: AsmA-like C-terminal domain-containing protein, partial [Lysobacterales bacterium]
PGSKMESIRHLFKVLASDANTEHPLSYLKRLRVTGAIQIDDRKNGLNWSMDTVDSIFVGRGGQVKGHLDLKFSSPKALNGIHTGITLNLRDDDMAASVEFAGIKPVGFAALDQRLAALAGLDISLEGNIDTSLTLPDTIHSLNARIRGGPGRFSYPDFYPQALRIDSLNLSLSADLAAKLVQLSSLDLQLGETADPLKLQLKGSAHMVENAVAIELGTTLQGLKATAFDIYWPKAVAEGARKWLVDNLRAGVVDNAKVDLEMQLATGQGSGVQLKKIKGSLDFSDLTVRYFGDLPAATGVTGTGIFDRRGFNLDIRAGRVNGVGIEPGKVLITGLDDGNAAISVTTHLSGPVAAVIATLEAPPIELGVHDLASRISERLGGRIEADFSIGLPLTSGLVAGDIDYQASGSITDGTLRNIYRDYNLQGAMVKLKLDTSMVNLSGPLAFAGLPLTIDWTTNLAGPGKGHSDFTIDAPNITGVQVTGLGYAVDEYLQGSFALKSIGELAAGGQLTASIETDLNNAALAVPQIDWTKKAGDGGDMDFTLVMEKNHLHASNIKIDLGKISTSGNVEFDIAGPLLALSMEHLSLPFAELKGLKLERQGGGNQRVTLQGGEASLESFLSGNTPGAKPRRQQLAVEAKAVDQLVEKNGMKLEIGPSVLDKVYIDKDTYFDHVEFSGHRDGQGWQAWRMYGHDPSAGGAAGSSVPNAATGKLASGQFSLEYGPPESGGYPVHVEAANLGSIISAVAGKDVMNGGYLVLDGTSEGHLMVKPIQATFEIDSFTLKKAPAIVEVLNLASLTQIISTLSHTGLAFRKASGDIQMEGMRLSSQQVKMNGGTIGLVVGGWVDLKLQHMDLAGTIAPLHKISAVVGKVPLLGQVVVGKDGMGIMAVDYKVKGSISQPEVSISKAPLTRAILQNLGGEVEDIDPARR